MHNYPVKESAIDLSAADIWQSYINSGVTLPSSINNRSLYGPTLDQLMLGSCSAFASTQWRIALRVEAGFPYERLSELAQYYEERVLRNTVNTDSGASMSDAVTVLEKFGGMPESQDPYDPWYEQNFTKPPIGNWQEVLKLDPKHALYIDHTKTNDVKDALARKMPVMLAMAVFNELEQSTVATTGMLSMPADPNNILGGHMVNICGFDDDVKIFVGSKGSYLVLNQWGSNWGLKTAGLEGCFYIPYEYVEQYAYDIVAGLPDDKTVPVVVVHDYEMQTHLLRPSLFVGQMTSYLIHLTEDGLPLDGQDINVKYTINGKINETEIKTDVKGNYVFDVTTKEVGEMSITISWTDPNNKEHTDSTKVDFTQKSSPIPQPKPNPVPVKYYYIESTETTNYNLIQSWIKKVQDLGIPVELKNLMK